MWYSQQFICFGRKEVRREAGEKDSHIFTSEVWHEGNWYKISPRLKHLEGWLNHWVPINLWGLYKWKIKKKKKGIPFVSNTQENVDQGDNITGEILSDVITYIGIKFNMSLKGMDKQLRINVQGMVRQLSPTQEQIKWIP